MHKKDPAKTGSSFLEWCPRRESNSHGFPTVFETAASAIPPLGRIYELYPIVCIQSRKNSANVNISCKVSTSIHYSVECHLLMRKKHNISHLNAVNTPNDSSAQPSGKKGSSTKAIGVLLVIISAVSWGVSGSIAQYLTQWQGVQFEWLNCVRMVGAAIVLMPLALSKKDSRQEIVAVLHSKTDMRDMIIFAIFGAFACQIGYLATLSITNSGTATMFEQLSMIIVVAVTCLTVKRRPTGKEVLALVLALSGAFCFCTQGSLDSLAMPIEGFLWGLVAAVGMATYVLLPVRLLRKFSGLTVTALAMAIAGISITIAFRPWTLMPELSIPVVLGALGTTVLGTVIAYLFFLEGVKRIGAVIGGLLDAIEPVTAIVASALWLGTVVTGWDAFGCALIIGMIVLITLPEKESKKKEVATKTQKAAS